MQEFVCWRPSVERRMVVVAFPVQNNRDLIAAVVSLDVAMCEQTCRDLGKILARSWQEQVMFPAYY